MKKIIFCLCIGFFSTAFADDFEKDERIKDNIRKELDSMYHMNFKAELCPVLSVGTAGVGDPTILPIPSLPWKFGGGDHHKTLCDGADESGHIKIMVKGFFFLRFEYDLRIENINGEITGVHIHCKVEGGNGPVAATLDIERQFGSIEKPDLGNGCELESFEDLYLAMKMGKLHVVIHTKEKPDGHLKGDIKKKGGF